MDYGTLFDCGGSRDPGQAPSTLKVQAKSEASDVAEGKGGPAGNQEAILLRLTSHRRSCFRGGQGFLALFFVAVLAGLEWALQVR